MSRMKSLILRDLTIIKKAELNSFRVFELFKRKYDNYNVSQFKDFGLKEELLRAVKEAGFEHPTRGIC